MLRFLSLLSLVLLVPLGMFGQTNFDALWERVNAYQNERKSRSASELVDTILTLSKQEKATPHYVKAVGLKAKYQLKLEDEESIKALFRYLESEVEACWQPAKPLIMVSTADVYWQYYRRNRWRINQRSATDDPDMTDVATWDLRTIANRVRALYIGALESADALKKLKAKDFKMLTSTPTYFNKQVKDLPDAGVRRGDDLYALLHGQMDEVKGEDLRPTAYDLVAWKALTFFKDTETGLTQPAETFRVDNPAFLHDSKAFLAVNLTTPDSTSHDFWATKLYQDLVRFHTERHSDAFVMVNLELDRLQYMRDNLVAVDARDSRYYEALERLYAAHDNHPASTQVMHRMAQHQQNHLGTNGFSLQTVDALCAKALERFPQSMGAYQCFGLRLKLRKPTLRVSHEQVIPKAEPLVTRINYNNLQTCYYRVYQLSHKALAQYWAESNARKKLDYVFEQAIYRSGELPLPKQKAFRSGSIKHAIEDLPYGQYVLVVADNPDFKDSMPPLKTLEDAANPRGILTYHSFQVTDLNYMEKAHKGETEVFVFDRTTGQPVEDATLILKENAAVWQNEWPQLTHACHPNR